MLIKISRIIDLIIVILSILVFVIWNDLEIVSICITYVIIFELVHAISNKHVEIGEFLITLYFQVIGPIDIIVFQFNPYSVSGASYYSYIGLASDKRLLRQYFLHSVLFYLLMVMTYLLISNILAKGKRDYKTSMLIQNNRIARITIELWFASILFSIIYYYIRVSYRIDIAGENPIIRFAGVVVYLAMFFKFLLLFLGARNVANVTRYSLKTVISSLLYVIILNLSDILLDRRAPVFYSFLIFIMFEFVTNRSMTERFLKKHTSIIVIGVLFVFGVFSIWTQRVRYDGLDVSVPFLYLLSRLVGFMPGIIALNFLNSSIGSPLSISDYLSNTFGNRSASINKFFTFDVLGFPITAIHRSAVPLFVGSRFYSDFIGFIFFAMLFGLIFALGDYLLGSCVIDKGKNKIVKELDVFIGCYLMVYAVSAVMNGTAEQMIDLFTVPVMLFVFKVFMKKTNLKKRSHLRRLL